MYKLIKCVYVLNTNTSVKLTQSQQAGPRTNQYISGEYQQTRERLHMSSIWTPVKSLACFPHFFSL